MVTTLQEKLNQLDTCTDQYATEFVDAVLLSGVELNCSDIHLQPTEAGLQVDVRIDGVLQLIGNFPHGERSDVVARLKVLADLLTYKTDVPQEGRLQNQEQSREMRISTYPTLHGERAVIRLFSANQELSLVHQLGLPNSVAEQLQAHLMETSGAILVTGPAGSGKTTTAYACMRNISQNTIRRSLVSLEDPIEVDLPGVAQSQVNLAVGFDLISGLKSMLRQDPEVFLIGEMRDRETAEVAIQASLTGQLVISTFHAGSCSEAINRLRDMGIESYMIRNGVLGIVNQRLVRRLCSCSQETSSPELLLGLPVPSAKIAKGCTDCNQTGFQGRILLAEYHGADQLNANEPTAATQTLWNSGIQQVAEGTTSPQEVRRVLGFRESGK